MRLLAVLSLITCFPLLLAAQSTPQQQFEQAVRTYNALTAYLESTGAGPLRPDQADRIRGDIRSGLALTDELQRTQVGELAGLARYFGANFRLEEGRLLFRTGDAAAALNTLEAIRPTMESFVSTWFPWTYALDGKNYTIRWENAAPARARYFGLLSELYFQQNKYPQSLEEARRAYGHDHATAADRTAFAWLFVQNKLRLGQKDVEMLTYALNTAQQFDRLSSLETERFLNEGANLPREAFNAVHETLQGNAAAFPDAARYYRELAILYERHEALRDETTTAFAQALRLGEPEPGFVARAYFFAARYHGSDWAAQRPGRDAELRNLGLQAVALERAALHADDCEGQLRVAEHFERFDDKTNAAPLRIQARDCETVRQRVQRKAKREAHFYIGTYLFPLLTFDNERRDYGVVLNAGGRRALIELSYQRINNDRERLLDLSLRGVSTKDAPTRRWSGYYTHVALKFVAPKRSNPSLKAYAGPLFAYNERSLETFTVTVSDPQGNPFQAEFSPTLRQYSLLLNGGVLALKGGCMDFYYGLGLSYNHFNGGNDAVWRREGYEISDVMLDNRKSEYLGIIGRIGITIGFGR